MGKSRTLTSIFPYPSNALRHLLYKELFFNGNGPPTISEPEAESLMFLKNSRVTKKQARDLILKILEVLIEAMTCEPPKNEPQDLHMYEEQITTWLQATTPAYEPVTEPVALDGLSTNHTTQPEPNRLVSQAGMSSRSSFCPFYNVP